MTRAVQHRQAFCPIAGQSARHTRVQAFRPFRKRCHHNGGTAARQADTRAAASADSSGGASSGMSISHGTGRYLFLGGMFALWYAFNIAFNIYNKQVLQVFKMPLTCTTYQFFLGSIMSIMWFIATGTRPNLNKATLKSTIPLAMIHTIGNALTNLSLGFVAVSFTHTIKASEPLFSVLLSSIFLKDAVDPYVLLSLLPIIGGVIGASLTEATFNWPGFLTALGSNVTFQSRNVLSKKLMTPDLKEQMGGSIGLFSIMTIFSFLLLAPVALLVEGFHLTPGAMQAMGISNPSVVLQRVTGAAVMFHLYQQVSYMILSRVSPVTHAIGNCVKRVVVIVSAVIFFGNPMSMQSKISTSVALAGVFAYSQVKRLRKPKGE